MPRRYYKAMKVMKATKVAKYFVMSINANRGISRFGLCKRGEWVHVPKNVYDSIQNAILAGEKDGTVVGWKTKIEYEKLEVIQ